MDSTTYFHDPEIQAAFVARSISLLSNIKTRWNKILQRDYETELYICSSSIEFERTHRGRLVKYEEYKFALISNSKKLGIYIPSQKIIGLNHEYLTLSNKALSGLLEHELLHGLLDFLNISDENAHGKSFHQIGKKLGISSADLKASIDEVSDREKETSLKLDALNFKVQKLLNLSRSTNPHESKLALERAKTMIRKFNLDQVSSFQEGTKIKTFSKTIYCSHSKRLNPKIEVLSDALATLFPGLPFVFDKDFEGNHCLVAAGPLHLVEIAESTIGSISSQMELAYLNWKSSLPRGQKLNSQTKDSFFAAFGERFSRSQQEQDTTLDSMALIPLSETTLHEEKAFGKTRAVSRRRRHYDSFSYREGLEASKKLNISTPVKDSSSIAKPLLLL